MQCKGVRYWKILWNFLLVLYVCKEIQCTNQTEILDELTNSPYDKRVKPKPCDDVGPLKLDVNMYVLSVNDINDNEMDYNIQIYFRQMWKDKRLSYQHYNSTFKYIVLEDTDLIWTPDLFITNEKEGFFHDIVVPNKLLRIYPNGNVTYSRRLTLTLQCAMIFTQFPFDIQRCPIEIESFGQTANDIALGWKQPDPLAVDNDLQLTLFKLDRHWVTSEIIKFNIDTYSRLTATFQFSRNPQYYLIHLFIPCTMLVIISWLSFWIHPRKLTARILTGLLPLLMMTNTVYQMNLEFPKVSYTRMVDYFTGISLTNSFLTLLVTIYLYFKADKNPTNTSNCLEVNSNIKEKISDVEQQNASDEPEHRDKFKRFIIWILRGESAHDGGNGSSSVDAVCRVIFPLAHILFLVGYVTIVVCMRDS